MERKKEYGPYSAPVRINKTFIVLENLKVGKPQNVKPQRFEIAVSCCVDGCAFSLIMLTTINFDDQSRSSAIKINNITSQCFLPIELKPQQLLSAKFCPYSALSVCHRRVQLSRM